MFSKGCFQLEFPSWALMQGSAYLLCSSHSESPLGQVEPLQRVCKKLCACMYSHTNEEWGTERWFWASERLHLLTLASPAMKGGSGFHERASFICYRIRFTSFQLCVLFFCWNFTIATYKIGLEGSWSPTLLQQWGNWGTEFGTCPGF